MYKVLGDLYLNKIFSLDIENRLCMAEARQPSVTDA